MARILIFIQMASALFLFGLLIRLWKIDNLLLASALAIGLILLLRVLITANNFLLASFYRSETPAAFHLGWRQAWRLFSREFHATMSSSSWTMAFHPFSKRVAAHPAGLPVLLIHGYGCNSGYWHGMSKVLVKANITHYAVDLEPVFSGIDDFVPLVCKAVESICAETGHPRIIIVAHSMGGLVARAYLRDHGIEHVARLITLGTPHRGTGLANFGVGSNSRQMRWTGRGSKGISSEWLQQLACNETEAVRSRITSIYSHHDNIVSPQTSSVLEGSVNIEFHGIGHVALALDPAIQARVVEEILKTGIETEVSAESSV